MFRRLGLAAALTAACLSATPASAGVLTRSEAAGIWVARNRAFLAVARTAQPGEANILIRQRAACQGLFAERMKIGGLIPTWAAEGQASFCRAFDGFAGGLGSKNPCGDLKTAAGYFGKASPFGDSAEVVPVSQEMVALIEMVRSAAREGCFRKC